LLLFDNTLSFPKIRNPVEIIVPMRHGTGYMLKEADGKDEHLESGSAHSGGRAKRDTENYKS